MNMNEETCGVNTGASVRCEADKIFDRDNVPPRSVVYNGHRAYVDWGVRLLASDCPHRRDNMCGETGLNCSYSRCIRRSKKPLVSSSGVRCLECGRETYYEDDVHPPASCSHCGGSVTRITETAPTVDLGEDNE